MTSSLVNGAAFLGIAQVCRIILSLLSTIVIARLLLPTEYGVMAMVAPVVALTTLFQELGFGAATIQRKDLTDEQSSALFWVTQFATIVLALLLLALAPLVGWFYNDPRPGYVTSATAIALVISGLGLQHGALLNREMRYGAMSLAELANALLAFVVSVIAAVILRNYWALFLGTLAGTTVQTAIQWYFSRWRPSLRPSMGAAQSFLRFSGDTTLYNLLNFLVRNADNVLIARFAGSEALGLYDRSYRLMMLPLQTLNGPLWRLLMPALVRLAHEPERYRTTFLFALRLLLLTLMPGFVVAAALSDELVVLLLGPSWGAAGPIFLWLGIAGVFQPLSNLCGLLMVTTGRTRAMLYWGVFASITTMVGFIVGLQWGVEGVAASIFFVGTLRAPILYALATRGSSVRQSDLYIACVAPLLGGGAGVVVVLALPHLPAYLLLLLGCSVAYGVAVLVMYLMPEGRSILRRFGGILATRLRRRSGPRT